mmetsp:Transcript_10155/g.35579  ORF Transcript_10155/g.35579 Transcript_10155/m.35579 type:complete len:261 (-) Transcript_10155:84-866(-)
MSSTGAGYDYSPTVFSPDGKIYQIEYAAKAVENSGTAVGVRCKDGILMGVEKLLLSKMLVAGSNRRIYTCDRHVGVALAGLSSDARQLALRTQDECRAYRGNYGEIVPPVVLADRMAMYLHAHTCYWYLRVFGASMLIAGYDDVKKTHELYMAEPSGHCYRYFGAAIGKGARAAKSEIEKYKFADMTVEEALVPMAKILHTTHDEMKDKPFELEMSWLSESTGWQHEPVPRERIEAADKTAKSEIEAEEMGSSSDDDDDE